MVIWKMENTYPLARGRHGIPKQCPQHTHQVANVVRLLHDFETPLEMENVSLPLRIYFLRKAYDIRKSIGAGYKDECDNQTFLTKRRFSDDIVSEYLHCLLQIRSRNLSRQPGLFLSY